LLYWAKGEVRPRRSRRGKDLSEPLHWTMKRGTTEVDSVRK